MNQPTSQPASQPKIIVLDDDPTGSQTVHSCLLLLKWDVETLTLGLQDAAPIFFVLTNTRSLTPEAAKAVTAEVCENLKLALAKTHTPNFLLVSRSDSTLRGHYPVETDAIAQQLGPFDAHFLTPAFFEGGRVTLDSTHYIESDGKRTATHDTEFAKDSVFGYSTSYLPDYVAEKTKGKIPASQVERFLLDDIRQGSLARLMNLHDNQCVAVDSQQQSDLDKFAEDLIAAAAQGKKFLFRSAASLLTALAKLPPQPTPPEEMNRITRSSSGAIIIGSHVKKTTQQLQKLLEVPGIKGIELDVARLKENPETSHDALLQEVTNQIEQIHTSGQTPAVYTSREELTFSNAQTRLAFGEAVSTLLMDIVKSLPSDIGFLISKGGITSNDTLSKGLALTSARLLGQVIPGVSIVTTAADHPQFANLPVVLFPGNVGDDDGLALAYQRLASPA
ncbi:four-carbon acid sugar kinase family protein [Leptolyngbya sp. BC1307]|uniref:four-carbon acid sugar kinase family protein n=1 Tax=Leptolyngbya sp. BC1307 TaxID=2029589 RepID=UPI000EFC345D|nr:four-carbon acid sugar kinase family protein [Leptolyngbya sp. BC1307]